MMKKWMLLVLVMLSGFAICYAAENPPKEEETSQPAAESTTVITTEQPNTIIGVIDMTDLDKKVITVRLKDAEESRQYTFSDTTIFLKADERIYAAALKKGDHVTLILDPEKNTVKEVKLEVVEEPALPSTEESDKKE